MSGDWLIEVLSEIEESNHSLDFTSLFERLIDVYGLRTVAYLGTGISTDRPDEPYFITTYTDEWVAHYKSQGYVEVDPVIQLGMRRILPIDWKDFAPLNGEVRNLFVEAAAFGLGRQGLSIPVHGRHGDRALFSITSDVSDQEWSDARRRFMRDFQVLAINIHAMALRLHGGWDNKTNLSPRERECLRWIAEGKTAWECSVILGLSVSTVRCYLESARHKLAATSNTHAVAKAIKADLLSTIP